MSNRANTEAISATAARWVARRDAGLSMLEQAEFEQWLDADARHQAAFEHYAHTWSALDSPGRTGAREATMRALQARVKRRRIRRVRAASAVACAVVVFAFAILSRQPGTGELHPPNSSISTVSVMQPECHVLEDGSTVEIKSGAVIDVRYDEATRRVLLVSGEAHFQVMKGQSRPFVVEAGGIEVRAVGTAFVVQLEAEQLEVLVTEGRVAVEKVPAVSPLPDDTPALPAQPDSFALPPPSDTFEMTVEPSSPTTVVSSVPVAPVAMLGVRERVVMETVPALEASAPVVTTVTSAEINQRLAWRIPRLEFSETPLAEVVALINRSSRLPDGSTSARLVLDPASPSLAKEPVSGFFRADNIEAFVHVLALGMGIEAEWRDGEIILSRASR